MSKSIASKMNGYRSIVSRQKNDIFKFKPKKKRNGDYMAKAVLVMDMPETCYDCRFCRELHEGVEACCDLEDEPNDNTKCRIIDDYCYNKPDWCPLLELPKHKRMIGAEIEINQILMNVGYNACLDEILEERKE